MSSSDGPGGKVGEKTRKSFKPQLPPVPNLLGQRAKPSVGPKKGLPKVPKAKE
jgi:hypothetical protein